MIMKWKLLLLFLPAIALAGAGVNGGTGQSDLDVTFNIPYGTFSLDASSFNYLASNVPILVDEQGHDLLTSVNLTTPLDPRVYAGITELLAGGTETGTATLPVACSPTPCTPCSAAFAAYVTIDNIAFSTGALGVISHVTGAAQILAESELLNLVTSRSVSSTTAKCSLSSFRLSSTGLFGGPLVTTVGNFLINLDEVDLTDAATAAKATPNGDPNGNVLPTRSLVPTNGSGALQNDSRHPR
jgi:hypothetical protein